MKIRFSRNKIELEKELNTLDNLAIELTSVLNRFKIRYVLVSGYVSILFGRSRTSEDIDLIAEKINFAEFNSLWKEIVKSFECLNAGDSKSAYVKYLLTGNAIRFSRKGRAIPNIEFKFPKVELDEWTLDHRKKVILNQHTLFISPLELQIPFKLFLGSGKDIEDARHLYRLFKEEMDLGILSEFNKKLKVEHIFREYVQ
ncbi:MAG: hypothetical protein HYU02_07030 [Thaumarchaeota archaeon]|nr:hypothetical protein [Nitrososphaerota archaeon]